MSSPNKRREMDLMKLMMSDYKVELINDSLHNFYIQFHGPTDSPYQGGVWKIEVYLPEEYPYKNPSITFVNKIYHPNVDEVLGGVCLDVLNLKWSPMYDLVNVFEVFLPQLLLYPNPHSFLHSEAAALLKDDKASYEQRVKEYCEKYAKAEYIKVGTNEESNDEEVSDESDDTDSSSENEIDGEIDP